MRAGATARAGHPLRNTRRALEEGGSERLELLADALPPASRDGGQAAAGFERWPKIHGRTYDNGIHKTNIVELIVESMAVTARPPCLMRRQIHGNSGESRV